MKYLIALCLCLALESPAYAGTFGAICKRGAACTIMPLVCLGKTTATITIKVAKLPIYLTKSLLDGAEMWAAAE